MATEPVTGEALPCEDADGVTREDRLALFRLMLLHRLIEERVGLLYRQGRVSGSVYTGRGQEGVGAAAGYALGPDDVCAPLNRELACHLARGVTPAQAFRNFLGKGDSPTRGRDGNMHFGVPERGVFPLVSMLGDLCPVTVGAALAFKRRREPRVALTFWGDGAMSTGDVHEGLNLAAVLKVPAVFVLQSNGYAYSTPTEPPDGQHLHGRPHRGRLGHPRLARRRQRRDRHAGRRARRGRGGARRRRAARRRGGHAAARRARRARRRQLHGSGAAEGLRRAARPHRAAGRPPAARRSLGGRGRRPARGRRRRGQRRAGGGREPRRRPTPRRCSTASTRRG